MHSLPLQYVKEHADEATCVGIQELLRRDSQGGPQLNPGDTLKLRNLYDKIVRKVLAQSKVVASTISNAGLSQSIGLIRRG